jgi:hypothetical protein
METPSRHVFYERTRREKVAEGQSAVPSLRPPGPVRMWGFTRGAKEPTKSRPAAMITGILRFMAMVIRARISGDYKRTSLFLPHSGAPVVAPKVLSQSERTALMNIL